MEGWGVHDCMVGRLGVSDSMKGGLVCNAIYREHHIHICDRK